MNNDFLFFVLFLVLSKLSSTIRINGIRHDISYVVDS